MTDQNRRFDYLRVWPAKNADGTRDVYGRVNGVLKLAGKLQPQATNVMVTQPDSLTSKLLAARVGSC